jgi:hypothetical protein
MRRVASIDEYQKLYQFSLKEPAKFWAEEAECIDWFHPYAQVCDTDMREASFTWFAQGKLNAAYNCVDRHAQKQPDKVAIRWVGIAVSLRWPEPEAYAKFVEAEARMHMGASRTNVPDAKQPVSAPTTREPAEVSAE